MSETQILGPCTECGTPRDACAAPDYCCDECLHFPPDWDGYEPSPVTAPVPAGPTDAQAELRAALIQRLQQHGMDWAGAQLLTADLLALPAVRDALEAQETLRRGRAEHQPTPAVDVGPGGEYPREMCTCGESFYDDCQVRRLLDGDPS